MRLCHKCGRGKPELFFPTYSRRICSPCIAAAERERKRNKKPPDDPELRAVTDAKRACARAADAMVARIRAERDAVGTRAKGLRTSEKRAPQVLDAPDSPRRD